MGALVGVIMGSKSDWPTMKNAVEMLEQFGIPYEVQVVSAHRTPDLMFEYASTASERGLKVIIAGAGGAAHLPGMVASKTIVPVLGVPVQSIITPTSAPINFSKVFVCLNYTQFKVWV
jgi:5-(carboxyamino)imidazole ribonucleotide mutase